MQEPGSDVDFLTYVEEPASGPAFASPWMVGASALAVGLTIDTLALHQPPGLGLGLGLTVALLAAGSAGWLLGDVTPRGTRPLLAAGLLLAGFVAVRTSPVLLSLNIGAVIVVVAVLAQLHKGSGFGGWTIADYLLHPFVLLEDMGAGAGPFVAEDLRSSFGEEKSRRLRSVGLGVLIGAPLLGIFGGLFASADVEFSARLDRLVNGILFGSIFWRVVMALLIAVAVAGLWRTLRRPPRSDRVVAPAARIDATTGVTVLALLVALFLLFVLTQIVGHDPQLTRNRDFSEDARRGFFQLVAVAFLVLNVLLSFDWLTRRQDGRRSPAFDRLAMVLIGLTGVVMWSALDRMRRYVEEFGLTELRFYTTVFMVWLAFVLAWFVATVLRNRRVGFALGLFASAIVFIIGLNVVNPDAFIVQANWDRHLAGADFSDRYNSELSVDSIPTLIAIRADANRDELCFIDRRLSQARLQLGDYRNRHGLLGESIAAWQARAALRDLSLPEPGSLDCSGS
jgi:hypothetical protein